MNGCVLALLGQPWDYQRSVEKLAQMDYGLGVIQVRIGLGNETMETFMGKGMD